LVEVTTPADTAYGSGRRRLLEAAREVFAEKGYRGATTREIAERAGLTEPMVFRHYGSKATLFERAAVEPVIAFMDEYSAEWGTREHGSLDPVDELHGFLKRLSDVLRGERELLLAIQAAGEFDESLRPAADRVRDAFGRVATAFESLVEVEFSIRGLRTPDPTAFVRVLIGLVLAMSLHFDWLTSGEDTDMSLSLERLLREASRLAVFGVSDVEPT
jgi:AcrR family transcriptional regulator